MRIAFWFTAALSVFYVVDMAVVAKLGPVFGITALDLTFVYLLACIEALLIRSVVRWVKDAFGGETS